MIETFVTAGLACIIAAIVGGGFKAFGVEIPVVSSATRQVVLGAFGVGLLVIALAMSPGATPPPPGPESDPAPVPIPGKPVSQISGIPLPGQPILVHGDLRDDQYRKAMEILEAAAARGGRRVVRLEVIKWLNVAEAEASRLRDGILWELQQRRISISYSTGPANMSPTDPRRETPWMEIRDFDIQGVDPQGRKRFAIGYWAIGQLRAGSFVLLWAWALVS
jgi:hypothetical protein